MKKRKTLQQKLKSQLRQTREVAAVDHEQAGITINFELVRMQSIGMGHGLLATLATVKTVVGEESELYEQIRQITVARVAQTMVALTSTGMSPEEANARILQGH